MNTILIIVSIFDKTCFKINYSGERLVTASKRRPGMCPYLFIFKRRANYKKKKIEFLNCEII